MDNLVETKVDKYPQCNFLRDLKKTLCRDSGEAHYDGKTIHGPWAYMCERHFAEFGIGLGTGRGQKLVLRKE